MNRGIPFLSTLLAVVFATSGGVSAEDVSEYADKPWFLSVVKRERTRPLVAGEKLVENPPSDLAERTAAILDALRAKDPEKFYRYAASPETGECRVRISQFYQFANRIVDYQAKTMRSLQQAPFISARLPEEVWCRYPFMLLPEGDDLPVRGNLNFHFDKYDYSLVRFAPTEFPRGEAQAIPTPDPGLENDPVRDREPVPYKVTNKFPPDYSQVADSCEYRDRRRVVGMVRRSHSNYHSPKYDEFKANPAGLDERRKNIVKAIWEDNEVAFNQLARSPQTGQGGLKNQEFDRISREWKRYRRDGLRMLAQHPVGAKKATANATLHCHSQWMTLPDSKSRTPARGNYVFIFDANDLSLSYVRFNAFPPGDISVLPYPDPTLSKDPVFDLPAIAN